MDKIFDEYYYKLYYWAIKKTNNKDDAEDLTNNIFVAVFEYFNKDVEVSKIDNLIWKIAHNIWSARAKKYIDEKNNIAFDIEYDGAYEEKVLDKIVYKEIIVNLDNMNLTKNERTAFKFYYIDDLSLKEISVKMNTNESNIKYYLYSARKKVKEKYGYE